MQIPIVAGIYADAGPDLRTSYPVNMIPVPKENGISNGFLRPADGVVKNGDGPGIDRGGINWNGICYRVMGSKLVTVNPNGSTLVLGDVDDDGMPVTLDYSFDLLGIASADKLFYYNPVSATVTQVSDADLGPVIDFCWVDGYFMTTDGESLVVTELNDPYQVNPLKYGSSEIDPDPVVALLKLRNEVYALNLNTIEVFDNVGGEFFPFQRINGAQIQKGCIGTHACCVFVETVAFLGGGRNEAPSIYLGSNATATKIATQEIEQILLGYTETELASVVMEARANKAHQHLYVHLPDRTLVYDASASQVMQVPVWFTLTSSLANWSQYRAHNFVWAYDRWLVGDPTSTAIGYFDSSVSDHYGQKVRWEFGTTIIYNESKGAVFNQLELVSLTGSVALGENPTISTSYSIDGVSWSQPKMISVGTQGSRSKRLVWFQQGHMRNWRIQRFQGDSDAHVSFVRLEAQLEPLAF